jgi:NAD(P)-dependent dehydrogenase (short-subunit alcohol dehydrogenase family)
VALVTGAAGGIGQAVAAGLVAQDVRVVAVDIADGHERQRDPKFGS